MGPRAVVLVVPGDVEHRQSRQLAFDEREGSESDMDVACEYQEIPPFGGSERTLVGHRPAPRLEVQFRCDLDSHGLVSLAPALCESSIVIFAFRSRLQAAFLPLRTAPGSP